MDLSTIANFFDRLLCRRNAGITRASAAFLLLVGLFLALPSRAQQVAQSCDETTLEAVGTFLHVDNFQQADYQNRTNAVVAASCKAWPVDAKIMLVAAAYMLPSDPNRTDDQPDLHFVIAMVDTSRWVVVRSFKGTVVQDATLQIRGHDDFHLDTARYDLAPGVRAFGVVFAGGIAPRAAEGWEDEYLALFVPDGPKLRQVFMVPLEQTQGNDTFESTIGVEKTRSHGFADLSITARSALGGKGGAGSRTVIHYDGRWYGGSNGNSQSERGGIFDNTQ